MIFFSKYKHLASIIFIILFATLSNFWIFQIFEYNFLVGELLIIETSLLFLLTLFKKNKAIEILLFLSLISLSYILLVNHYDKGIFSASTIESIQIQERQQYYAHELNKIYKNRIGIFYFDNLRLVFGKISNNFFSALDLNFYFSQAPLIDYGKYSLFFAPLLIIGLLSLLTTLHKFHIIYFFAALSINAFIKLDSKLDSLVMFPLISLCIAIGFIKSLKIIKENILSRKI